MQLLLPTLPFLSPAEGTASSLGRAGWEWGAAWVPALPPVLPPSVPWMDASLRKGRDFFSTLHLSLPLPLFLSLSPFLFGVQEYVFSSSEA